MRTKTLIVAASIICGIAAIIFGAWVFITYKSYSYKNQITAISEGIKSKSSEDSYLISLKNTLREAKDEAEALENRFISEEDVPAFITMLEDKAAAIGTKVDFGAINVKKSDDGAVLGGVLEMQITGSGSWSEVTEFIAAIDSLPYASTIEEAKVFNPSVMSEAPSDTDWRFNLGFRQYLGKKI